LIQGNVSVIGAYVGPSRAVTVRAFTAHPKLEERRHQKADRGLDVTYGEVRMFKPDFHRTLQAAYRTRLTGAERTARSAAGEAFVLSKRLGRIVAARLPIGSVGAAEVDRRRRYRKVYEFGGPRVLEAVNVTLRKAHDISFCEWRGWGTPQQQDAAPAQRDPDLFRSRVGMWRILGARRDGDSRDGHTLRL